MENLSLHVSYDEATHSQTASREGIDNTPTPEILAVMKITALNVLEKARELVSSARGKDTPIYISSFYRCPKLNGDIPGSSRTSQHEKGEAIDMMVNETDFTKADLFALIKAKMQFDQLIWEYGDDKQPAWVHCSFSSTHNRNEILKATLVNGAPHYELMK